MYDTSPENKVGLFHIPTYVNKLKPSEGRLTMVKKMNKLITIYSCKMLCYLNTRVI